MATFTENIEIQPHRETEEAVKHCVLVAGAFWWQKHGAGKAGALGLEHDFRIHGDNTYVWVPVSVDTRGRIRCSEVRVSWRSMGDSFLFLIFERTTKHTKQGIHSIN